MTVTSNGLRFLEARVTGGITFGASHSRLMAGSPRRVMTAMFVFMTVISSSRFLLERRPAAIGPLESHSVRMGMCWQLATTMWRLWTSSMDTHSRRCQDPTWQD